MRFLEGVCLFYCFVFSDCLLVSAFMQTKMSGLASVPLGCRGATVCAPQ